MLPSRLQLHGHAHVVDLLLKNGAAAAATAADGKTTSIQLGCAGRHKHVVGLLLDYHQPLPVNINFERATRFSCRLSPEIALEAVLTG